MRRSKINSRVVGFVAVAVTVSITFTLALVLAFVIDLF